MERLETILANLRRRDNIREFIPGLEDSECWPYPDGESHSIPATFEDECGPFVKEVELRSDKIHELLELFLINVERYHPLSSILNPRNSQVDLADVCIELCPEEGLDAYMVSYETADKDERERAPKLDLEDVATVRSAFIHRYEWVISKLQTVNCDRNDAFEMLILGYDPNDPPSEISDHENEAPLSEEEDHDALLTNDGYVSGPYCTCSSSMLTRHPGRGTRRRRARRG